MAEPTKKKSRFVITIEPVGFLLVTAGVIQGIVHQNLYINKVCRVNFQLNTSWCDPQSNLSYQDTLAGNRIQNYVSSLLMWATLIETLPSIIFVLFLGPWSNEHGRKPLMIFPLIGYILSIIICMVVKYVDSLRAEYLLFAVLPLGLLGGFNTMMMASNSYLIDITTEETRTFRLSVYCGMIISSVPIANYVSVYILDYGGEWAVWTTSLAMALSALFYLVFFVSDSRDRQSQQESDEGKVTKSKLQAFTDGCLTRIKAMSHCFAVAFKPRAGYRRVRLGLMLIMTCLSSFSFAPSNMAYLYTRKKFSWDASDFAMYGVVVSVAPVIGSLLVLPLLSGYFKINDWFIGVASLLGNIGAGFTIAYAANPLMMYLSSLGTILAAGIGIVINSTISKIVQAEELGFIYSATACLSSILPIISSSSVNLIYVATLESFPGCIFAFGASVNSAMLFLSVLSFILQKRDDHSTGIRSKDDSSEKC